MSVLPTRLRKRALLAAAALGAPVAAIRVVSAVDASPVRGAINVQTWQAANTPSGGEVTGSDW